MKKTSGLSSLSGAVKRLKSSYRRLTSGSFNSKDYWRKRYASGGNSGTGSYGRLAEFKADVLNTFVSEHQIARVLEFGCGDGNQLSLATYPSYVGLDVSTGAISLCARRFHGDATKSFFLYDPDCFVDPQGILNADLTLSLDVLYHLIEDVVFETYLQHLFHCSSSYVIIYSTNDESQLGTCPHVKHRRFTDYVARRFPDWVLVRSVANKYPHHDDSLGSLADFFIFSKPNGEKRG